jgi:hypothetical protein
MTSATRSTALPCVFVLSDVSASQLAAFRALEVRKAWPYLTRGVLIWCLQTFLELRDRGLPVRLMSEPQAGAVNFVHVRDLARLKPAAATFVVSIQADYRAIPWTCLNIVQNLLQADQKRSFFIPHWPQPSLVPRNARRDRVECVAYAGNDRELAGSDLEWSTALKACQIEFRKLYSHNWNDYSNVDVLLAVRSFDKSRHANKPPSKLLNAWHAGIPLVGGYDSAFEQVGRPGYDYLRACTLHHAVETIRRLRDDPELYRSVVDAGAERAAKFTRQRVGDAWEALLSGPISSCYTRWQKNRVASALRERLLYRTWRAAGLLRSIPAELGRARPASRSI